MKSIFRLSILTLFHALFFAYMGYIFVIIAFAVAEITLNNVISVGCSFLVCIIIPLFMGMIAVNNKKQWLISLPIQVILDVIIRCAGIGAGFEKLSYINASCSGFSCISGSRSRSACAVLPT